MKKTIFMMLLCIFFLVATACGKKTSVSDTTPVSSETNTCDEKSSTDISKNVPIHMKKKLCNGLEIDANIPPLKASSLPTYQACPVTIAQTNAVSLFLQKGHREIATQAKDNYDPKGFSLIMKGGQEIFHRSGQLSYNSETSAKSQEILDVLQRYEEAHPQEKLHTLSFMSPQEVIKQGEKLIKKLVLIGNPDIQSRQIVGLNSKEIMKWQRELLKDNGYKEGVKIGKTTILNDLTLGDDAYLLAFSFRYQDVPIFNQDNEPSISSASDGLVPPSTKAVMLVTAKGLRYFSLEGGVSANGIASKPITIIPADQALSKLVEKYKDTIQFGKQCITKIWLEYIPQYDNINQKRDTLVTLTPYWCFRMANFDDTTGKMDRREFDSAERINAITGKDLAYGG